MPDGKGEWYHQGYQAATRDLADKIDELLLKVLEKVHDDHTTD
jgi:hypothetical protein